jgi:radical SAM superfamily enzyme YgiQ (UPF0313 family)
MNNKSVVFVAFQQRENLGIGYMHAILSEAGYDVSIIEFRKDSANILKELSELNPLMVGFSVIFEYHIYEFQELVAYLRDKGIKSHFTAGGHFASLRPSDLFELMPTLDSIVRFEGEHSILELVDCLHKSEDWKAVPSISYRSNGEQIDNPLRALEPDLDSFPFPFRPSIQEYVLERNYATILAGRGCIYNCSFCDIREFYGQSPGPVKRIRNPAMVVDEMDYLRKEKDCSVFLFQDDDFPVRTSRTSNWVDEFCCTLRDRKLEGKLMWKINCRPDEVDLDSFKTMKQHGLFKVYLGIEDGTDAGLLDMNKRIRSSDIKRGIQILKDLGITIDYGFMLWQPTSKYVSLNENLAFLGQVCSDGYMPVSFLKMKPYLATRIEKDLMKEGRLKGRPGFLDYDFYEKSIDDFYTFVHENFNSWFFAVEGLNNSLKWARNYLSVYTFFHGTNSETESLSELLRKRASEANRFVIETTLKLSALFESGRYKLEKDSVLAAHQRTISEKHNSLLEDITQIITQMEIIYGKKKVHY